LKSDELKEHIKKKVKLTKVKNTEINSDKWKTKKTITSIQWRHSAEDHTLNENTEDEAAEEIIKVDASKFEGGILW
jgi:hypothetical protein